MTGREVKCRCGASMTVDGCDDDAVSEIIALHFMVEHPREAALMQWANDRAREVAEEDDRC